MSLESTGVRGLDTITGGLPPNGLTMLVGSPGAGKTVLAMQIACHRALQGRETIFLSVYSEPHEKLMTHMQSFTFFDPQMIGQRIELLSLKAVVREGPEETLSAILQILRTKQRALLILDGYRGLRNYVGADAAQEMIATLSSQLPYHDASCLIASESNLEDASPYPELASADAIINLAFTHVGTRSHRSITVVKMRGHRFSEGLHTMRITGDGIQIFPRLATDLPAREPQITGQRLTFGLPAFDTMLGGGLPEFSTTAIIGEPGTGKTTFGLHYVITGAEAGEEGLFVTLREPAGGLRQKAEEIGLNLKAALDSNVVHILRVPPVEVDTDLLVWQIKALIEQRSITRVVIDGVGELERAASIYGPVSDFVAALTEYLWRSGCTTLLIEDGRMALNGDLALATSVRIAQNRIVLRRIEYRTTLYRVCSILNMQTSSHDTGIHEFTIGHGGIQILETSESAPGVLSGITREQPIYGA